MDQKRDQNIDIKNTEEKEIVPGLKSALTEEEAKQISGGNAMDIAKIIKTTYDILTK